MSKGLKPAQNAFIEVQCFDLSSGGFSFWLDGRPDFQMLIVALGVPPHEKLVSARVVRVEDISRQGQARFRVGCQFLRRING